MINKELSKVPPYISCSIVVRELTFKEREDFPSFTTVHVSFCEPSDFLMWEEAVNKFEDFFMCPLLLLII